MLSYASQEPAPEETMDAKNPQFAGKASSGHDGEMANVPLSEVFPPKPRSKNLEKGFLASIKKFIRQTSALTSKNLKLSLRNSTATLAQLWIGVLFLILLLIIGAAIQATGKNDTSFIDTKNAVDRSPPAELRPCIVGKGQSACYNFAYASSRGPAFRDDAAIETLVDGIAAKLNLNAARNVSGGILAFNPNATTADIDAWIIANPNITKSIFVFENSHQWNVSTSSFRYIYRFNASLSCREIRIYKCDEPWLDIHVPMISALNAAINDIYGGVSDSNIRVSFSNFPHPDLPTAFDAMKNFGTLFIYIAFTFNYVILLTTIVKEKEDHLVESMRQMGMMNSSYWISWILSATVINTLMVFLIMLFGVILQFELFLETSGQLLLTILWLSAQSFTAIALFFSSFVRTTATARVIGVMIFIITFIAAPLLYLSYYSDPSEGYNGARAAIAAFPFFSFYHALQTVIDRSSGSLATGMTWEQRTENLLPPSATNSRPTYWSVNSSMSWMVGSFFLFSILAWYIEQIVPNEFGRRKQPWFILQPSYWGFNLNLCRRKSGVKTGGDEQPPTFVAETDEDVKEEALAIYNNAAQPPPAVVLRGVSKIFGWRKPFTAVNRVFYGMNYGQLTAILGHNGSGKSTTFNMLTGLMTLSNGDAEIFGRSVSGDMAELHASMGVCPQHDVLWAQLTAREHLELFARIKGLDGSISDEAKTRLEQVKLNSAADSYAGGYSGGMRRRLSIAIAMLGDPDIVFLDEPTTGMDPVTRREVLEMISQSKRGDRVIVLTSHAMEEVEMLADKVVVMSRGLVQAVGTVVRLKKRFGLGYKMTMFGTTAEKMTQYVAQHSSLGEFKIAEDPKDGAIFVSLPRDADGAKLIPFFQKFESDKESLGVTEYSLSLSTLEEVFLNLSKSEEERENEHRFASESLRKRHEQAMAYQPAFREKSGVSTYAQVNALFWKSLTFQCKNCAACCCIILFPVLIMFMLIVLDRVVFLPLKIKAVCGDGISVADCPTLGPNLVCAAKIVEFRSINALTSLSIGVIDLTGNRGQPVNENCNSQTCFDNLEKMDSSNFPVAFAAANPGFVNYTYNSATAQQLDAWHSDLLFLIDRGDTVCQKAYDNAYSLDACPKSPASARQSCLDEKRLLTEAKQYWDAQKDRTTNAFDTGACLQSANGGQKIPTAEFTAKYNQIEASRDQCRVQVRVNGTIPHFGLFNLTDAVGAVQKQSQGFMGSFGLSRFLNTDLQKLNNELWLAADLGGPAAFGGSNVTYLAKRNAWFNSIGVNPADYQYIPTINQMCTAAILETDGNITRPFLQQITFIMGGSNAATNLCAVFSNLDAVRGLSTQQFNTDRNAMDFNIYKSWYGREVQTPFMATEAPTTLPGDLIYKARQYKSRVSALYVRKITNTEMDIVIYHNKTANRNLRTANWVPLVHNAEAAFIRSTLGREVEMRTQEMPTAFKCNRDEWIKNTNLDLDCDLLPTFLRLSIIDFVAVQLFPFLFFTFAFLIVNQIVYEKEQKLRVIMRMNGGLKNSVYWVVAFWFFYAQFVIMSLMIYILGNLARLKFTSLHSPVIYWSFVLSWGALLVVFSFFMSIFFSNSQSSTAGVFLFVLVINLVGIQLLANIIQDPFTNESSYSALMWLPPFVMIRVIIWIGLAGALNQKINASEFFTFADGALSTSIGIMWAEFFACIILVWYLDNVYVAGFGTRKPLLFFLSKKYWTGEKQGNERALKDFEIAEVVKPLLTTSNNADVQQEYERVIDESPETNMVVRIVRLHKQFGNGYIAVKSLSLGINENECFGLLGHNGAGKTTAISMLVGLYEPTSGTAIVDGLSINNDMDAVQTRMGVCPQHDVCWGTLSVRDHLLFYGRLKGIPFNELAISVDRALFDVNLKQFEHRPAAKLSGGMRRRLSTAMSLIGTPRVVYLDEPSTGLDPASKRALWNVIEKAKGNKSVVLTTHSMEEAEALCDRIGIMALGEMQCLGTAAQLKSRYGTGYTFFLAVKPSTPDSAVRGFVDSLFGAANAKILGRGIGGTYKFEVARKAVVLSQVFSQLESPELREKLNVLDWSLTETTLEEVFLKLADMAHVDEALSAKPKVAESSWDRFVACCRRTRPNEAASAKDDPRIKAVDSAQNQV